jgi:hypothetical protein
MATPGPIPLRPRNSAPAEPLTQEAADDAQDPLAVHTLDEAAAVLRVKVSWLERRAAARKIPFAMLGGAYHFTSAHLRTIVHLHEVTPASQEEATEAPRPARRPTHTARRNVDPQTSTIEPLRARPRTGSRRAA